MWPSPFSIEKKMKKLVIFDLDGTLLNTIDDLGTAANHALTEEGFPTHHISSYPHFVGNGITRLIERVLPVENRDEATVARVRKRFVEYYDAHLVDFTRPYPGVEQMLEDLMTLGIGMAVASNKYQSAAEHVVRHFFPEVPWSAIEGQKEGIPVKPDPSVVFGILSQCPTEKGDVLYVGDSGVDMETGRRAGVETVGVTWGFRPESELAAAYADHIVNDPASIVEIAKTSAKF